MTCRYLTWKLIDTGGGYRHWAHGYACGKPTLDERTTACEDHLPLGHPDSKKPPHRGWPGNFGDWGQAGAGTLKR